MAVSHKNVVLISPFHSVLNHSVRKRSHAFVSVICAIKKRILSIGGYIARACHGVFGMHLAYEIRVFLSGWVSRVDRAARKEREGKK